MATTDVRIEGVTISVLHEAVGERIYWNAVVPRKGGPGFSIGGNLPFPAEEPFEDALKYAVSSAITEALHPAPKVHGRR